MWGQPPCEASSQPDLTQQSLVSSIRNFSLFQLVSP